MDTSKKKSGQMSPNKVHNMIREKLRKMREKPKLVHRSTGAAKQTVSSESESDRSSGENQSNSDSKPVDTVSSDNDTVSNDTRSNGNQSNDTVSNDTRSNDTVSSDTRSNDTVSSSRGKKVRSRRNRNRQSMSSSSGKSQHSNQSSAGMSSLSSGGSRMVSARKSGRLNLLTLRQNPRKYDQHLQENFAKSKSTGSRERKVGRSKVSTPLSSDQDDTHSHSTTESQVVSSMESGKYDIVDTSSEKSTEEQVMEGGPRGTIFSSDDESLPLRRDETPVRGTVWSDEENASRDDIVSLRSAASGVHFAEETQNIAPPTHSNDKVEERSGSSSSSGSSGSSSSSSSNNRSSSSSNSGESKVSGQTKKSGKDANCSNNWMASEDSDSDASGDALEDGMTPNLKLKEKRHLLSHRQRMRYKDSLRDEQWQFMDRSLLFDVFFSIKDHVYYKKGYKVDPYPDQLSSYKPRISVKLTRTPHKVQSGFNNTMHVSQDPQFDLFENGIRQRMVELYDQDYFVRYKVVQEESRWGSYNHCGDFHRAHPQVLQTVEPDIPLDCEYYQCLGRCYPRSDTKSKQKHRVSPTIEQCGILLNRVDVGQLTLWEYNKLMESIKQFVQYAVQQKMLVYVLNEGSFMVWKHDMQVRYHTNEYVFLEGEYDEGVCTAKDWMETQFEAMRRRLDQQRAISYGRRLEKLESRKRFKSKKVDGSSAATGQEEKKKRVQIPGTVQWTNEKWHMQPVLGTDISLIDYTRFGKEGPEVGVIEDMSLLFVPSCPGLVFESRDKQYWIYVMPSEYRVGVEGHLDELQTQFTIPSDIKTKMVARFQNLLYQHYDTPFPHLVRTPWQTPEKWKCFVCLSPIRPGDECMTLKQYLQRRAQRADWLKPTLTESGNTTPSTSNDTSTSQKQSNEAENTDWIWPQTEDEIFKAASQETKIKTTESEKKTEQETTTTLSMVNTGNIVDSVDLSFLSDRELSEMKKGQWMNKLKEQGESLLSILGRQARVSRGRSSLVGRYPWHGDDLTERPSRSLRGSNARSGSKSRIQGSWSPVRSRSEMMSMSTYMNSYRGGRSPVRSTRGARDQSRGSDSSHSRGSVESRQDNDGQDQENFDPETVFAADSTAQKPAETPTSHTLSFFDLNSIYVITTRKREQDNDKSNVGLEDGKQDEQVRFYFMDWFAPLSPGDFIKDTLPLLESCTRTVLEKRKLL